MELIYFWEQIPQKMEAVEEVEVEEKATGLGAGVGAAKESLDGLLASQLAKSSLYCFCAFL